MALLWRLMRSGEADESQRWESNPQPPHYECGALPIEATLARRGRKHALGAQKTSRPEPRTVAHRTLKSQESAGKNPHGCSEKKKVGPLTRQERPVLAVRVRGRRPYDRRGRRPHFKKRWGGDAGPRCRFKRCIRHAKTRSSGKFSSVMGLAVPGSPGESHGKPGDPGFLSACHDGAAADARRTARATIGRQRSPWHGADCGARRQMQRAVD